MKTLLARLIPSTLLVLAACGDDGNGTVDAAIDGPPDPCAPLMTFTGEYIAWDSGTSFMGIFGATFAHRTETTITDMTAPNGRFEMCIPPTDDFVDVTPMAGSNLLPGTVVVLKDVISFLPDQSYRSFTPTRAAEYGFDANRAHVFVHVAGGQRTVTTAAAPGVTKIFDGAAWVDGDGSSNNFYLGNIDPAGGSTTLQITGGTTVGAGTTIPLTAGAFTYITVLAR